jgi:protein-S-isoprenylcysteine O-methyltransferase Ste14
MSFALTRRWAPYRFDLGAAAGSARRWVTGERIAKICIVALFSGLAMRVARDFSRTGHATGLLLLVSEALVVVLTMIRRPAGTVDRSFVARLLTIVSMFGPSLVRPASNGAFVSDALTMIISGVGLTFVVMGKLTLGRSFGLAPANRGVVSTGLYRAVRHPIYMGYLITHVGFVVANPTSWNLLVLALADIGLLIRAVYEERTLAADSAYRDYMQRVRWRIVPKVF